MLAAANLRKNKGQAISLFLMMVIVAMFMNIGIVMFSGIGSFFDQRAEELNSPHFMTFLSAYEKAEAQMQFVTQHTDVLTTETQVVVGGNGDFFIGDTGDHGFFMFARKCETQQMNPPTLVGSSLPLTGNYIYIPHFMMLMGGFEIGDTVRFNVLETELSFIVAGSTEDVFFGSMNMFMRRIYVSDEMFYGLKQQFSDDVHTVLFARMENINNVGRFTNEYFEKIMNLESVRDTQMVLAFTATIEMIRGAHIEIPMVIGVVLSMFAIILLVVSLIVIRFRINNSIDEGIVNIGVQKAIGYRNRQIITSILLQFGLIAFVGAVAGILVSQVVLPSITSILGSMFPFPWAPGFDIIAKAVILAIIVASVLGFSLISTRRVYKLYPLVALRGGVVARKFKKNPAPLDKAGGPLVLLLAVKDLLQNKKQAFAIGLVMVAISFAASSGLTSHYAINVNNDAFITSIAGEMFDIHLAIREGSDTEAFANSLRARPEVARATGFAMGIRLAVDDTTIFVNVVEDTSVLNGDELARGRLPVYNNEIALGNGAMRVTGKGIGDWVTIRSGGYYHQFLVTGLVQNWGGGGMFGTITEDGFNSMQSQPFPLYGFHIYLADGVCASEFAEIIRAEEEHILNSLIVFQEIIDIAMAEMGSVFETVAVAVIFVTGIIVVVTIYLVIKTTILRKRRELGIQKALGYTTFQLMNQISLNLTPPIVIGAALGSLGGYLGFSSLFVMLARGAGVVQVNLPAPLGWTIVLCAGLILLAYAVSMLVSCRIRKISAYTLVTE